MTIKVFAADTKAFIDRASASSSSPEELTALITELVTEGIEPVFVAQLPNLFMAVDLIKRLKDIKFDSALAALKILAPKEEVATKLETLKQLISELEFKLPPMPYKFSSGIDFENLGGINVTSKTVSVGYGYSKHTLTIESVKKVAFAIIQHWRTEKAESAHFKAGRREIDVYPNQVEIGCKTFTRARVEALFVRLGYLSQDGNILISE